MNKEKFIEETGGLCLESRAQFITRQAAIRRIEQQIRSGNREDAGVVVFCVAVVVNACKRDAWSQQCEQHDSFQHGPSSLPVRFT